MSMYEFQDTIIATEPENRPLPAEALQINGVWLDRLLPEFRTLYVSGRELMARELTTQDMGALYGSSPLYSRFPSRVITVGFAVMAESPERFRDVFNELQRYVHEEASQLVFNDEPDKYFRGTLTSITEPSPGSDRATGEMIFTCPDPRKRALYPVEVYGELYAGGSQVMQLYNSGNIPAPISYEILMNSENGYIGITDGAESLQFGYLDEVDGGTVEESEVLFDLDGADFFNNPDLSISDSDKGGVNEFAVTTTATHGNISGLSGDFLLPGNLSNNSGTWGGCVKTVTIPADSGGVTGAEDFELSCKAVFEGAPACTGVLRVVVSDSTGIIAGTHIVTNIRSNQSAGIYMYAAGVGTKEFRTNTQNTGAAGRNGNGRIVIRKSGSKVYIAFGEFSTSFEADTLASRTATKATVWFANWSGMPTQMTYMGVKDFQFRKDNVDNYVDIPNRYQPGDLMEVNGAQGRMYLNGQPDADDEVIGSTYFPAKPGMNTITVSNSLWASQGVTVKARMREAWL